MKDIDIAFEALAQSSSALKMEEDKNKLNKLKVIELENENRRLTKRLLFVDPLIPDKSFQKMIVLNVQLLPTTGYLYQSLKWLLTIYEGEFSGKTIYY